MPGLVRRYCLVLFAPIAVVVAAVAGTSGVAQAAPNVPAFWVNSAGTSASCQASYTTIGAAVTAAESYESGHPGRVPVVNICPGTYSEQVTVTKSLVLTRAPVRPGLGPVTIQLPATVTSPTTGVSTTNCQADDVAAGITPAPESVLEICAAGPGGTNTTGVNVTVNDVTVAGGWQYVACDDSLYDVLVGGGATLSLTDSVIEKAEKEPLDGCQGGVGIQIGVSVTSQIGHASLRDDTVETYQKNGIDVDGPGSTAQIDHVTVTGAGPTPIIGQNGIQVSFGATADVEDSSISGNNYTGPYGASAAGILVAGGGGSACGIGATSPLVKHAKFTGNRLTDNDMGIAFYNLNSTCTKPAQTATDDLACGNKIQNSHGYAGGTASADANISGFPEVLTTTTPAPTPVGYQAGVSDYGSHDVICDNAISGPGYAPLDSTSSLPNAAPPAFVRPVDIVSGPAIAPQVYGNTYDGRPYRPS
jgi:hypothetical protein